MTIPMTNDLESLTYWLRLEDVLPEPEIGERLIHHARHGQRLVESGADPAPWIEECRALLELVGAELSRSAVGEHPELIEIMAAAPPIDSLHGLLAEMTRPEVSVRG